MLSPGCTHRSLLTCLSSVRLGGVRGWGVVEERGWSFIHGRLSRLLVSVVSEFCNRVVCFQAAYHKQFGRIFREKWGTSWQVHVADPDLIERIYRHQGQYPNRPSIQAWSLYRKLNKLPAGLVTRYDIWSNIIGVSVKRH